MVDSFHTPGLLRSARYARVLALAHCPHAFGGDCTWYHGVWQYLRVLGMAKTAGGQSEFLDGGLRSLISDVGIRRVLISGAADDAVAAIALGAFRAADAPMDLSLVDRCDTPLELSRWRLAQEAAVLTTHRADILRFSTTTAFDVVIANSFLSYVAVADWPLMFARWAASLRTGGKLLLTNRVRPGVPLEPLGFSADAGERFCTVARRRAELHRAELGVNPDELANWVGEYVARLRSYPLRSVDELHGLLRGAGFVPEYIETHVYAGEPEFRTGSGPTAADRAQYVRVVATRS
jgi:hypothetical protein